MDITLALLPWTLIWKLQMKKKEKAGVAIAMSMGILYVPSNHLLVLGKLCRLTVLSQRRCHSTHQDQQDPEHAVQRYV